MPDKIPPSQELVLAEKDVAEILERAIKLDGARTGSVSVDQLREVALEVGVSADAFEAALDEFVRVAPVPDEPSPKLMKRPRFFSQIRTALTVAAGLLVGGVSGTMLWTGTFAIVPLGALLIAGGCMRLVLSHRKDRSLLPFVMDTFWLWASFAASLGYFGGFLDMGSVAATVVAIAVSAVVGGFFVKRGEDLEEAGPDERRLQPGSSINPGRGA